VALPVPDKGRHAPPVHMIKLTATGGFLGSFAGTPGADLRAHNLTAPDNLS
jgi:hypothetical protein